MIQWEAASMVPAGYCTIYHTNADRDVVRFAAGPVLVEVDVNTPEEAINFMDELTKAKVK